MGHRKLSPYKKARNEQRRHVLRYIMERAYVDRRRAETVSLVSRDEVLNACQVKFLSVVPNIVKGEVLTDSRGLGSLQRSQKRNNVDF
jgi:hypothetical protein